jgi:hypothetical protein
VVLIGFEMELRARWCRACAFIPSLRARPTAISDGHAGPERVVLHEGGETLLVIHLTDDDVDLRQAQANRTDPNCNQ